MGGSERAVLRAGVEASRTGGTANHLVAGIAGDDHFHGGERLTRRRRFQHGSGVPAGESPRGWRGNGGGAPCVLGFVRGGAERRRLASAAAAIHGVTRERKEREGSSVVFLQ